MKSRDKLREEVLKVIKNETNCTIALTGSSGKTSIGLTHLSKVFNVKKKYLVVVPKLSVKQSWIDDAHKFNFKYLLKNITFSTYLSLNKQDNNYDWVYLDEIHNLTFKHNNWLNKNTSNILGLTGTLPSNPKNIKRMLIDKYAPVKFTYTTDEAVNDNMLNDYQIIVHPLELSDVKNIKKTKKDGTNYYLSEKDEYNYLTSKMSIVGTKEAMKLGIIRMRYLQKLKSKEVLAKQLLDKSQNKCILFCNTIEQSNRLCHWSYNTKNPKSETNLNYFKRGTINKLSCVEQLSEGINIPNLKEGIIMHFFSANSPKSKQKFYRLCRLLPTETAILRILYYKDTIDEKNVREGLKQLNQSKITWL